MTCALSDMYNVPIESPEIPLGPLKETDRALTTFPTIPLLIAPMIVVIIMCLSILRTTFLSYSVMNNSPIELPQIHCGPSREVIFANLPSM